MTIKKQLAESEKLKENLSKLDNSKLKTTDAIQRKVWKQTQYKKIELLRTSKKINENKRKASNT